MIYPLFSCVLSDFPICTASKVPQKLAERRFFDRSVDLREIADPLLEPALCDFPIGSFKAAFFPLALHLLHAVVSPFQRVTEW
jgi:hypothetical protein